MKKLLWLALPLMIACGKETPGPTPDPTPAPPPPTAIVEHDCRPTGATSSDGPIYAGQCQETPKCKKIGTDQYAGECRE